MIILLVFLCVVKHTVLRTKSRNNWLDAYINVLKILYLLFSFSNRNKNKLESFFIAATITISFYYKES